MTTRRAGPGLLLAALIVTGCGIQGDGPTPPSRAVTIAPPISTKPRGDPELDALYRQSCQPCHSLDLVEHQRLDRDDWEWVLEDMVEIYGATWITPKQQERLLDYLSERLGVDTKSR